MVKRFVMSSLIDMAIVACGILAILFAITKISSVFKLPCGNDRMIEVAKAIFDKVYCTIKYIFRQTILKRCFLILISPNVLDLAFAMVLQSYSVSKSSINFNTSSKNRYNSFPLAQCGLNIRDFEQPTQLFFANHPHLY